MVRREAKRSCIAWCQTIRYLYLRYLSGRAHTYEGEGPWERVVFDAQVVCEEADDAGHNHSGDELSEAEKVEGERVVGGWVLGYLRGRHYFIGTGGD